MLDRLIASPVVTWLGRIAFGIGLGIVVYLSVVPTSSLPSVDVWDKAQHALAYFALMIAGGIGFRGRRPHLIVALGLIVLGCTLEALQTQLPMRQGSLGDALANTLGVLAGYGAVSCAAHRNHGRRPRSTPSAR